MSRILHVSQANTDHCSFPDNVRYLHPPRRGHVQRHWPPAKVLVLRRPNSFATKWETALSLLAIALLFALAMAALIVSVRKGVSFFSDGIPVWPWW